MNNSPHCALSIGCEEKYVEETENTKFLGLHVYNHLSLKSCIAQMIPNLIEACCTVRWMFSISNINPLIMEQKENSTFTEPSTFCTHIF